MVPSGRRQVSLSRRESAELIRALTARGASVRLPVKGSSMHPALRDGDVVTVAPPGPEPVPVGAIVAAEAPVSGGLVVHRVVGRTDAGILLRGDNAADADGTLPEEAVLGVVVKVERNGRLVRPAPAGLRRPLAFLVRGGLIRRLNRLRGSLRPFVPSALLAFRESRRASGTTREGVVGSSVETESR